jgi:hypothetical protein
VISDFTEVEYVVEGMLTSRTLCAIASLTEPREETCDTRGQRGNDAERHYEAGQEEK